MTDEQKALALACECAGRKLHHYALMGDDLPLKWSIVAHADTIMQYEALQAERDAQAAEIATLKSLVQGWHYLAVGPDEMGDYHTQKALIEASEPYAHPALKAPTVFATYTGKGWVAYATEAAASAALRARAALAQETQP